MMSLHFRLSVGILLGISLLVTAGGAVGYQQIKSRLYKAFDEGLVKRARSLAGLIEHESEGLDIEWLEDSAHPPGHEDGLDFVQVVDAKGQTLTPTEGIEELQLWKSGGTLDEPVISKIHLPGGAPGRAVSFSFVPRFDPDEEDEDLIPKDQDEGIPGVKEDDEVEVENGLVGTKVHLVLAQ